MARPRGDRKRLTDRAIKALPAPASGYSITYDVAPRGFGVRTTAAGVKTFILRYRIGGRERTFTIDRFGDCRVEKARTRAEELRGQISSGADPQAERNADRAAPTFDIFADEYLKEVSKEHKQPRTVVEDVSMLKLHIRPRLGKRRVADITRRDIESLHAAVAKPRRVLRKDGTAFEQRCEVRANRVLALVKAMLGKAVDREIIDRNPAKGVKRYDEQPRTRYLSSEEIRRLSQQLNSVSHKMAADAIRFLLLTGARRGEVLSATWDDFNLEDGIWTKPSAHVKTKREHRVPLSASARALLTRLKETAGNRRFVFSESEKPLPAIAVKRTWRKACAGADISGARLHDLRHTFASLLASDGLSLPIIGALLGHTQSETTSRYSHLMDDPLRQATERVGEIVTAVSEGRTAEIIPMRSA